VIVLGVRPRARLSVVNGEVDYIGGMKCKSWYNIANVWSEDGFIVLKLPARSGNQVYSITQILPTGIGGDSFVPSNGSLVPAFEAEGGTVTFVGAIRITGDANSRGIYPDPSVTFEEAKQILATKFPGLSGEIKAKPLAMKTVTKGC